MLSISTLLHGRMFQQKKESAQCAEIQVFSQVVNVKNILLFFVSYSTPEQEMEERKCNYERYRGLVQNDFANSGYHKLHS